MKRCPYCAEAIQDDTRVCPHCHMDATANSGVQRQATPPPVYQQPAQAQQTVPGNAYPTSSSETSGKATASLIAGVVGYLILPIIAAIPAIILGHLALSEIKKSAGRLKGHGMAVAGLVLGYVQLAGLPFILIIAAIAIPNLIKSRMAANEASAVGSLRTLTTAEIGYATVCPKIGFTDSLTDLGPRGTTCRDGAHQIDNFLARGQRNGYVFTPSTTSFSRHTPEISFGWNADPVSSGSGSRHFFVDQTGVIRYSETGPADAGSLEIK